MTQDFMRVSSPAQEGVLRGSKWLKHQMLVDDVEMAELMEILFPCFICIVSKPVKKEEGIVPSCDFLSAYRGYVDALKTGKLPDEKTLRPLFSSILTSSKDLLYAMQVGDEKYLIKALRPVIQLQAHQFLFSEVDRKFHPMVLSENSVSWGIQFSYPQIYQDPKTHAFSKVVDSAEFPNTQLFLKLVKWVRKNTLPSAFEVDGKKIYVPIRIGKKCFSWIRNHPQLQDQKFAIRESL